MPCNDPGYVHKGGGAAEIQNYGMLARDGLFSCCWRLLASAATADCQVRSAMTSSAWMLLYDETATLLCMLRDKE